VAVPVPAENTERDWQPCPYCGQQLPENARRCLYCGKPLRPRRAGTRHPPRRDLEPHRAGLILTFGVLSVVLLPTCVLCPLCCLLGLAAWIMGRRDLDKIQAHVMDPAGMANTRGGTVCGMIGTLVGGLVTLLIILGALR
jgi:hypothetical protein